MSLRPGGRVAHDRQQAIEKQCGQRGFRADAEPGDHEDQKRQRRDRLDEPGGRQDEGPRSRAGGQPRRPAGSTRQIAAASEIATSVRCSPSRRSSRGQTSLGGRPGARSPNFAARKSAATRSSGTWSSLARAFIAAISGSVILPSRRARAVMAAGERVRQIGAIEPDALIDRKESEIVDEHAQVACFDLGVGRVEIGGLDLVAVERGRPGRGRAPGRRAGEDRSGRACRASRRPVR